MIYHLKQLLPFSYKSNYTDNKGNKHQSTWRMWFGKCFNVEDNIIAE